MLPIARTLRSRHSGFTLIEMMIVVSIIAILAAVALPSYQDSVIRSARSDTQAVLQSFAQAMERHYVEDYTYLGAGASGDTGSPAATLFPSQSPIDGSAKFYNLTISVADVTSFTVRATPIAGGRQNGNGFIEVNSLGQRFWDKNNSGSIGAGEDTWDR